MHFERPFFPPEDFKRVAIGLEENLKQLPQAPEGHISPDQAEFLYHLVRLIRPGFVVETGFCVGHSACVILRAQESVDLRPHLLSIDNCRFEETKTASDIVKNWFDGFTLVEGDSKEVLESVVNAYLKKNEGLTLDFALVDGGHDEKTAMSDLETLSAFLINGGYLWLDDFDKVVPYFGVNKAGRAFARQWGACQRFRTKDTRGFMLFQKVF